LAAQDRRGGDDSAAGFIDHGLERQERLINHILIGAVIRGAPGPVGPGTRGGIECLEGVQPRRRLLIGGVPGQDEWQANALFDFDNTPNIVRTNFE
jgi:hypothetical protein